jgi:hypothetical protein
LQGTNLKKLLRTVEALADLGPELTADRDFSQTARKMLTAVLEAAGAREAVLFSFGERPSVLTSVDAQGFALLPEPSVIPLLPRHVHTLTAAGPVPLNSGTYDVFLSSNGNVALSCSNVRPPKCAATGGCDRVGTASRRRPL